MATTTAVSQADQLLSFVNVVRKQGHPAGEACQSELGGGQG